MCHICLLQNFRDLVLEGTRPALAGHLVAALVADQLDKAAGGNAAGSVSELSAVLQAGAPAYFRDQDRQFFQVGQHQPPAAVACYSCCCAALPCHNGSALHAGEGL